MALIIDKYHCIVSVEWSEWRVRDRHLKLRSNVQSLGLLETWWRSFHSTSCNVGLFGKNCEFVGRDPQLWDIGQTREKLLGTCLWMDTQEYIRIQTVGAHCPGKDGLFILWVTMFAPKGGQTKYLIAQYYFLKSLAIEPVQWCISAGEKQKIDRTLAYRRTQRIYRTFCFWSERGLKASIPYIYWSVFQTFLSIMPFLAFAPCMSGFMLSSSPVWACGSFQIFYWISHTSLFPRFWVPFLSMSQPFIWFLNLSVRLYHSPCLSTVVRICPRFKSQRSVTRYIE